MGRYEFVIARDQINIKFTAFGIRISNALVTCICSIAMLELDCNQFITIHRWLISVDFGRLNEIQMKDLQMHCSSKNGKKSTKSKQIGFTKTLNRNNCDELDFDKQQYFFNTNLLRTFYCPDELELNVS